MPVKDKIVMMKKTGSLKMQLVLTYFLIVLFTLCLFSLYMLTSTEKYLVSNDTTRLFVDANMVANGVTSLIEADDYLAKDRVSALSNFDTTDTRMIICDKNMVVRYDSSNVENLLGKKIISEVVNDAFKGKDVDSFKKDKEKGYSLEVGVPIIKDSDVLGVVLLTSSLNTTKDFIDDTRTTLLFITVVISIIVGLLSSFIAEMVTTPIEKLITVTKNLANGQFDKHVEVKGTRELRQLADAFNTMTDKLNDLEEKRRSFVSDASHELKTPLSGIKLVTESILQMETLDKAVVDDFLTDMNHEVDRLTRIIDRLLKLTKMDTVTVEKHPTEKTSMNQMLDEIVHRLTPVADRKQIKIDWIDNDEVALVLDYDKMWEAIYNIVDNAIKYSEERSKVTVGIKRVDDTARISVSDEGIGIPQEEINAIFERFYRVDKARARDTGGTGLGLAIALDAVKFHGGQIEVTSRENEGSTFTIVLKVPKETIII